MFERNKDQYVPDGNVLVVETPVHVTRKQARDMRKLQDLLDDPTAFRIVRPGWENRRYVVNPTNPGVALAVPRDDQQEPSKYQL